MFERACALGPKDRNDHNQKECIVEIDEPERRYVQRKDQKKNEAISPKQKRDQGRQEENAGEHDIEDQPREALVAHVPEPRGCPVTLNSQVLMLR
jgi:hypothetical protein